MKWEERPTMPMFKVSGMTCGHCERAVTKAIHSVDPTARVNVDRLKGTVGTDSKADANSLAEAIRGEGYEAEPLAAA